MRLRLAGGGGTPPLAIPLVPLLMASSGEAARCRSSSSRARVQAVYSGGGKGSTKYQHALHACAEGKPTVYRTSVRIQWPLHGRQPLNRGCASTCQPQGRPQRLLLGAQINFKIFLILVRAFRCRVTEGHEGGEGERERGESAASHRRVQSARKGQEAEESKDARGAGRRQGGGRARRTYWRSGSDGTCTGGGEEQSVPRTTKELKRPSCCY